MLARRGAEAQTLPPPHAVVPVSLNWKVLKLTFWSALNLPSYNSSDSLKI